MADTSKRKRIYRIRIQDFRNIMFIVVLLFLSITASGCGRADYTASVNGKLATVSSAGNRIIIDSTVYTYDTDRKRTYVEITYPNGSIYMRHYEGDTFYDTWDKEYETDVRRNKYMEADPLINLVKDGVSNGTKPISERIYVIPFIFVGVFVAAFPDKVWYLSHGWRYRDAEPSDLAIYINRISGIACVIIGLICFFI